MNRSRLPMRALFVTVAGTSVLAAACFGDRIDHGLPLAQRPGLVTGVSVYPDTIPTGGAAEIRIIVSNLGDETYELAFADEHPYGVEILGETEISAWFPCHGDSVAHHVTVHPGQVRVAVLPFRPGHGFCFAGPTEALPPGRYVVRGGLRGYEAEHPWGHAALVVTTR